MIVFEKDHGSTCGLQGERTMCYRVDFRGRNATVGDVRCRIKHPQTKTRGKETLDRRIDFRLADEALTNSVDECGVFLAAAKISSRLHGLSDSVRHIGCEFVADDNIGDRGTV